MVMRHACPRCGRTFRATGEVEMSGRTYPIFQCMECLDQWELDGEIFEHALTWAVDDAGQIFLPDNINPMPEQNS